MEPQRWAAIEALYRSALSREMVERRRYLASACGNDLDLLNQVESLLAYADAKLSNYEVTKLWHEIGQVSAGIVSIPGAAGHGGGAAIAAPVIPTAIGHYRIIRLIGEGGMGVVYEAEQEQPRRAVALKIVKPGLFRRELLWRFVQESEVLGRLQHPGIAQIYEAGNADNGFGPQPWFAMEFIRGETLLKYAGAHQLTTHQRLELMAKVCEAVQHAHLRGIIHRDLKPGNILVEETGQPKVLDFGVARVTNSDVHATQQTDLGQLVGTLAYMSPEQVLADPLELDTRSDVYALGVILFELLAGHLPYTISPKLHEAVQTIKEEEPASLSSVSRNYRGDIETIVAKALEKNKARRYSSAADLAADIHRYLKDEPITARPASASYQLQKFARRHTGLLVGIAAVFAVLITGIVVSTWEATRARRAEQTALTESATAKAINDFLQNDMLALASADAQAQPDTKPDPDIKVRTALDRAAARISSKFKNEPLVEASIRQTIGNTYMELGVYPEAQRQLERAVDVRRRMVGEKQPGTLASMQKLAEIYYLQGKHTQAEQLLTKVMQTRRQILGPQHLDTLDAIDDLVLVYQAVGKFALAEPLSIEVTETHRRVLGEEHPDTLTSMNNLAAIYHDEGKNTEAEELLNKVLKLKRHVLGEEHPSTLATMNNLSVLYYAQGKYADAEPLITKVLEIQRRVLGDRHPQTLMSMSSLAMLYTKESKYTQAESLNVIALDGARRLLGENHPDTLTSMYNLALLYYDRGRYAEAVSLITKAVESQRRVLGEQHPSTLTSMGQLANLYESQGRHAQAEPLCIKVLETRRRVLGDEHPETLQSMSDLAQIYSDEGKYTLAEPLYIKILEVRRRKQGLEYSGTAEALTALGKLRLKQQRYVEAEQQLREALNILEEKITRDARGWTYYNVQSTLGASLTGQKRYAEAEPLLLSGYEGMRQRQALIAAYNQPHLDEAGKQIVQLYTDWRKPDKATEWRRKLRGLTPQRSV